MAARVTQETVEVLRQPSAQRVRVSQVTAEALTQPTAQRVRLSQVTVEALYPSDLPPAPTGGRSSVVIAG
jgi:hypothetical protein